MNSIITYTDGSNNSWEIFGESIEYIPMTKEMSSSGMYSGGEPKTIKIDNQILDKIIFLVKEAFSAVQNHSELRKKGTGLIQCENKSCILEMNSPEKENLENFLKSVLNQSMALFPFFISLKIIKKHNKASLGTYYKAMKQSKEVWGLISTVFYKYLILTVIFNHSR